MVAWMQLREPFQICWLKLVTTIAKKRKRLEKAVAGSQEPQSKKASVDTGGIDINALIDGSGIVLD